MTLISSLNYYFLTYNNKVTISNNKFEKSTKFLCFKEALFS